MIIQVELFLENQIILSNQISMLEPFQNLRKPDLVNNFFQIFILNLKRMVVAVHELINTWAIDIKPYRWILFSKLHC